MKIEIRTEQAPLRRADAAPNVRRMWGAALALALGFGPFATASAWAQVYPTVRLVVLGDSLSAGFLLPASSAFPAVLEAALRQRGYAVAVLNGGVSGDTASAGFARVDQAIPDGIDGVILELGANDKLRGIDPEETRLYLAAIIARLQARGIPVLLAGIQFVGADTFTMRFNAIYRDLAQRYRVAYHPDIYAGLLTHPRFRLLDGVHPSAEGVEQMVRGILPTAERFVARLGRSRSNAGPRRRGPKDPASHAREADRG